MSEQEQPDGAEPGNRRKTGAPGQFKAGKSGNPTGRPKRTPQELALVRAARAKTTEALETVLVLMRKGESDRVRLAAALAVLERGCGKPGDLVAMPLDIPAGASLAEQARAIASAAAAGQIPIPQAVALLTGLGAVARIVEVSELEARIAALEATKP